MAELDLGDLRARLLRDMIRPEFGSSLEAQALIKRLDATITAFASDHGLPVSGAIDFAERIGDITITKKGGRPWYFVGASSRPFGGSGYLDCGKGHIKEHVLRNPGRLLAFEELHDVSPGLSPGSVYSAVHDLSGDLRVYSQTHFLQMAGCNERVRCTLHMGTFNGRARPDFPAI